MYRTGDKLKIHKIHTQVKYNSSKQTHSAAKQNYPASVAYLRHSARKRGGLILQRSWAHAGHCFNIARLVLFETCFTSYNFTRCHCWNFSSFSLVQQKSHHFCHRAFTYSETM